MNSRYSHAYLVSCMLHGAVVAAILLLAYLANQTVMDKPKIFELVAGGGDNYAATEAPAIGVPGGIKAILPAPTVAETPAPTPNFPVAEPAKIEAVPVPHAKPAPVKAKPTVKPVPKTDEIPNFTRTVERTAHRRAARLEARYKRELEAEQRKQMSYEAYLREHGGKLPASSANGLRDGVVGGSTANKRGGAGGRALTREDSSLLEAYFALLRARSRENFVAPSDVNDKLAARVVFYLSADGTISRVRIANSSGNAEFDRAVVDAFRRTHSIGPRPDGRGEEIQLSFSLREEDAE